MTYKVESWPRHESIFSPRNKLDARISKYRKEVDSKTDALIYEILAAKRIPLTSIGKKCTRHIPVDKTWPYTERFFWGEECILEVTEVYEDETLKTTWKRP